MAADHMMRVWAEVESAINGALSRDELPPDHMRAIAANLRRLADSLDTMAKPPPQNDVGVPTCTHGVTFDPKATRLPSADVRRQYPRLNGDCPLGCGYHGIAYASMAHYVAGDW